VADILRSLARPQSELTIPALRPGDTVRVHNRIVEGGRERVQIFQGVVMKIRGTAIDGSYTVRRIAAHGVGVERSFPFQSHRVEKVEVLRHGQVRRAKLYFLRERLGKSARLRERREYAAQPQATAEPAAEEKSNE
jgi:large subunit ribosomal protein L19